MSSVLLSGIGINPYRNFVDLCFTYILVLYFFPNGVLFYIMHDICNKVSVRKFRVCCLTILVQIRRSNSVEIIIMVTHWRLFVVLKTQALVQGPSQIWCTNISDTNETYLQHHWITGFRTEGFPRIHICFALLNLEIPWKFCRYYKCRGSMRHLNIANHGMCHAK